MTGRTLVIASVATVALGCNSGGKARSANVELRKEIADLKRENDVLRAEIGSLQAPTDDPASRPATLPATVVRTAGLKFGRLTGVKDGVLEVYVVPVDKAGDELKGGRRFRRGTCSTSRGTSRGCSRGRSPRAKRSRCGTTSFRSTATSSSAPSTAKLPEGLTLRVQFTETLTGGRFSAQQELTQR